MQSAYSPAPGDRTVVQTSQFQCEEKNVEVSLYTFWKKCFFFSETQDWASAVSSIFARHNLVRGFVVFSYIENNFQNEVDDFEINSAVQLHITQKDTFLEMLRPK